MALCCSAGPQAIQVNGSTPFAEKGRAVAPIRCYKLNKKRRSYNVVSLSISDGNGRSAAVQQCIHTTAVAVGPQAEESSISFQVELTGRSLLCRLFLVHDVPGLIEAEEEGGAAQHAWRLVSRAQCAKGCEGPLLATSRRLSILGKRMVHGTAAAPPAAAKPGAAAAKDLRHMYVSIDEACTHVGASAFRLVAAIYDGVSHTAAFATSSGAHRAAGRLLATTVSPPIKVLANNDAPTGAGHIPLDAALPADWEGWADLDRWASQGPEGAPGDGLLSPSGTPLQPRSLEPSGRTAPSLAPQADGGSAGSRRAVHPAASPAAAATAGSASSCPSATACQELPQLQAVLSGTSDTLLSTAVSTTGMAPPPSQPLLSQWSPDVGAVAAATAADKQQQRARHTPLGMLAAQPAPLPLSTRCSDLASQLRAAAAAQQNSCLAGAAAAAVPPSAQSAVAIIGAPPGGEAAQFGVGSGSLVQAPEEYRVVRARHLPPANPSPFAARRATLPDASSFGSAGAPTVLNALAPSAPAPWDMQAPAQPPSAAPPPAVDCARSWTELQSSASTGQQAASLLPPEAYEVKTVAAEAAPAAAAWALHPMSPQPAGCAAALDGCNTFARSSTPAATTAGWDAVHWAAYQTSAARQADAQLVAAGLAAAGRLGLLSSPASRPTPPPQHVPAYQHAPLMQFSRAQGGPLHAPHPAVVPVVPDLPTDVQLLSMIGDAPLHELEFLMPGSIFDDILPREQ